MRYFIKIILAVVFSIFLFAGLSHAEKVTFVKEYTYQASELDSKASCRTISLEMVKRLLLEEFGTYLISETEVKDFKLTKDQVTVLTAGIVGAEVVDEKWDGKTYWLKAKVSADPKAVAKTLDGLRKDSGKIKEMETSLRDANKRADEALNEIEKLKKEVGLLKADRQIEAKYKKATDTLTAKALLTKGLNYSVNEEYDRAIEAYTSAIALDPSYADAYAYSSRGVAYTMKGQYDKAIEDCSKAISLNPKDAYAYSFRGVAYANKGQYDRAIEDYSKAIALDHPNLAAAYSSRGVVYAKKGQYDKAIEDYSKCIALDPKNAEAYYFRGGVYFRKGDIDKAIEDFQKACDMGYEDGCKGLKILERR
ncbi:MAG: hypothetical protein A2X55_10630 [Nitrospirae bacterium GWB2_47_37]|nr:MAG: hypothetical protein A2Z82_07130 [Nitrospirae bacterium GWA2_46_11]OGW23767.1 MAG: hypothetical protein A2X55_10630 [Nitrospirae bacterium GWB2_47_37]